MRGSHEFLGGVLAFCRCGGPSHGSSSLRDLSGPSPAESVGPFSFLQSHVFSACSEACELECKLPEGRPALYLLSLLAVPG